MSRGLAPPIGVGVLPSGCVAWDGQCCWVSATAGTCTCVHAHTGAPSAPCPHLPHICGLSLQKPSYSHALTACTCMQSHTHTSPLAQRGDAPSPPTPCPHSRSDVGCCALCPQGNPLQHVMGEWGAGEAGGHAKHCHQLPHVPRLLRDIPQPNMPPPGARRVWGVTVSCSASLPTFVLVLSRGLAWGRRMAPSPPPCGTGRASGCCEHGPGVGQDLGAAGRCWGHPPNWQWGVKWQQVTMPRTGG